MHAIWLIEKKKTENEFGFIQKDEQKEVNDKLIIHYQEYRAQIQIHTYQPKGNISGALIADCFLSNNCLRNSKLLRIISFTFLVSRYLLFVFCLTSLFVFILLTNTK